MNDTLFVVKNDINFQLYNDIVFCTSFDFDLSIVNGESDVFCPTSHTSLKQYKKVVWFITPEHQHIDMLSAISCMARKHGINMLDDSFTNTSGKLYEMFRFNEVGLPVPDTFYGSREFLCNSLEKIGGVGVLKATHSAKGKDNFLVHSSEEIAEILDQNPTTDFILQNFIPNDGDYRVVTIDFEPKMVIYRSSNGSDHRNNTSLGGSAKIIPLNEVDPEILNMAAKAARATNIRLAGVDIIQNRETGNYALLEINRTPQLLSGSFIEEKSEIINDLIRS